MSQENVETVQRAIAAVNARDIDGYLSCCTKDIELLTPLAPLGAEYAGADGIRRFLADIEDAAPDFRIEVQRVQAVGDNHAIAFIRTISSGRVSGLATGVDGANVYDFTDGKIRRARIFFDRQEALEAVGLAE
jgi:ketosteroid isomerase-like protein